MSKNGKIKKLCQIEERLFKEGIIFKKRILPQKTENNDINKTVVFKNNKKEPILKKKKSFFLRNENLSITERNNDDIKIKIKKKLSPDNNNKIKYKFLINNNNNNKAKINIPNGRKFLLNLGPKDKITFSTNGYISPRIPKINFQKDYPTLNLTKKISFINPIILRDIEKNNKLNHKNYNKIKINRISDANNNKENDINYSNINIYRNKNNVMKRNKILNNYKISNSSYIINSPKLIQYDNNLFTPRNNYDIINKNFIKRFYKSSIRKPELNKANITDINLKGNLYNFSNFEPNKIENGYNSKISLKHNISNKKTKNIGYLNIPKQKNNLNKLKQSNITLELGSQEIKIKNSKLIDYMKKCVTNINEQKSDIYNNNRKRRRHFSFNIFDKNDELYNNNNNNISFFSNNNNINEKRVTFNRKSEYKKNRFSSDYSDYMELAKICENQEKIISDLVKNVQSLNNQICDKDLCINELNNKLYSIKYDLINTLQKTNGNS